MVASRKVPPIGTSTGVFAAAADEATTQQNSSKDKIDFIAGSLAVTPGTGSGGGTPVLRRRMVLAPIRLTVAHGPARVLSYKGITLGRFLSISEMRVFPEGWVDSHCGGAPLLEALIFCHKLTPLRGS